MLSDELVVEPMGIAAANAVDLAGLTGAERFVRIKTPGSRQQSLAPQHLVHARNAAGELVGDIDDRSIAVRQFAAPAQQFRRNGPARRDGTLASVEQPHSLARADGPL